MSRDGAGSARFSVTGSTDVLLANVQNGASLAYNFPYDNLRLGAIGAALRSQELEVEYFDSTVDEVPLSERVSALAARPVVVFDTLYRISDDVIDSIRAARIARPTVRILLVGRAAAAIGRDPRVAALVDTTFDSADLGGVTAECLEHVAGRRLSARITWATTRPERPFRRISQRRGVIDVEATRGCAYSCSFCAVDGTIGGPRRQAWEPRDVADVVDEIASVTAELDVSKVQFVDDNLIGGPRAVEWALDFADELRRRRLDIAFSCYARLDHALDRVLDPLAAAGLVQVHAGVESGSLAVLRRLRKGTTPDKLSAMIKRVRRAGVQLVASLIVFEPRMTLDELEESLIWLRANRMERFFSLSTLIPFETSRAFGELADQLLPQAGPSSFAHLGYRFTDARVDAVYHNARRAEEAHSARVETMMRARFQHEELLDAPSASEHLILCELDDYRLQQIEGILRDIDRIRR